MNGISLDTNIFIYYFQQNKYFGEDARNIFEKLALGKYRAVTSIITLIELLSFKLSDKDITLLQDTFLQTPNLSVIEVGQEIALTASKIRRIYGFRLPDAIQLATGVSQKVDFYITNDAKLKRFKETKVVLLKDFAKR